MDVHRGQQFARFPGPGPWYEVHTIVVSSSVESREKLSNRGMPPSSSPTVHLMSKLEQHISLPRAWLIHDSSDETTNRAIASRKQGPASI